VKIRRDDIVLVITGKDKGKTGKVRRVLPRENRVVVEGVNRIKRHVRALPGVRQAGIITQEAPIHASNVMLLCTKCNRPTRVGFHFLENGQKVRICRACKEVID
jgi:large subunit ribosomal protein L24